MKTFIENCIDDIEFILTGRLEPIPNNILYGLYNLQYQLNNIYYIKIPDRDGTVYKQIKSNITLQTQFFSFQQEKSVATPLQCFIRVDEFIFLCITEMPI